MIKLLQSDYTIIRPSASLSTVESHHNKNLVEESNRDQWPALLRITNHSTALESF